MYRFVCDLHGLLGYTAQEIHAMVDLQPLSATTGNATTSNVSNNNNNENHSTHGNHPHDDNPISLAPSDNASSLMGHHAIKLEQVQKPPRHIFE